MQGELVLNQYDCQTTGFNDRPFSAPLLKLHVMRIPTTTTTKEKRVKKIKSLQGCSAPIELSTCQLCKPQRPEPINLLTNTDSKLKLLTNQGCKLVGSFLSSSQILHSLSGVLPVSTNNVDRPKDKYPAAVPVFSFKLAFSSLFTTPT